MNPAGPRQTQALDPASVGVLKQAIESKDYATRLIAIEAVGDAHTDALAGWLEHALGDPEHDVRMAAIDALDRMHTPRALGLLLTVRDDTSEELDIRAVAAGALLRATSER
jgi:HEAT repeat protein